MSLKRKRCEDTKHVGSIEIIMGCMYSGKTARMLKRVEKYRLAMQPAVVIKYAKDARYASADFVASADGAKLQSQPASEHLSRVRVVNTMQLTDITLADDEIVVGIDEGQFYPDLLEQCEHWANQGKKVIVSGLDGTYTREPFGQLLQLIPKAEKVVKLRAVCMKCKQNDASFTERLVACSDTILVGALDQYVASCRTCWQLPPPPKQESSPKKTE